LGDVTNTAARLQGQARGGEILMCAVTYQAVREQYPDAEPVDLELKGKGASVRGFRLRVGTQAGSNDG
jgi:class 3 adenylate cyclase